MAQMTKESHGSNERDEDVDDTQLKVAQEAGKAALADIDDEKIDDLLADIDDILEENAVEFVQSFIQRGGQ